MMARPKVKITEREIRGSVSVHPCLKVYMYNQELDYLKWLVVQKPNIETGGDLFGLWQNEDTAIVQLILGPGSHCARTTTSFHQDVEYLETVGGHLTTFHGLCNIGEWHSHHRIGLAEPSFGDKDTVWNHMSDVTGGRFLVFIANIHGAVNEPCVKVGCFMFRYRERKMLVGDILTLQEPSPLRNAFTMRYTEPGAEPGQDWETFLKDANFRKSKKYILLQPRETNRSLNSSKTPIESDKAIEYDSGNDLVISVIDDEEVQVDEQSFWNRIVRSVCGFPTWQGCLNWLISNTSP